MEVAQWQRLVRRSFPSCRLRSARGFGRKLDSEVGGDLDAAGKAGGSRWGNAFKVGALALLGGGLLAGKFLKGAVDEAREAAKVTARTENVIKSMGLASKVSAGQIADLAGAISAKTGIDDEAIQSGQNLLLTFRNVARDAGVAGGVFEQTSRLMVDLSAAMGTDAKGAAIQLGKALNDPIKGISALTRVGVSFSEQQKEQIEGFVESGQLAKAQGIILGELKNQFGGAAAAMATPADKLKVAYGNLKEEIGAKLIPIVDRFIKMLLAAGPTVSAAIDKIGPAFDRVKAALAPALPALVAFGQSMLATLIPAAQNLATALGPLLSAILAYLPTLLSTVSGVMSTFGAALVSVTGFMAAHSTAVKTAVVALGAMIAVWKIYRTVVAIAAAAQAAFNLVLAANPFGLAALAIVGAYTALWQMGKAEEHVATTSEIARTATAALADTLDQVSGAATKATRESILLAAQQAGILALTTRLGVSTRDLIGSTLGNEGATKRLSAAYRENAQLLNGSEQVDLNTFLRNNTNAFAQQSAEVRQNTRDTQTWNQALKGLPPKVATAVKAIGTDITEKQLARLQKKYGDLSAKQVKTIVAATGTETTIQKIHGVWKVMDATGKRKADLGAFEKSFLGGMNRTEDVAKSGGRGVAKALDAETGKARPNLNPFSAIFKKNLTGLGGTASSGGHQVGSNLGSGINQGIDEWVGPIALTAARAVTNAIAAARKAGDIHSPSRKTAEIGRFLAEGLAEGIKSAAAAVDSAALNVVKSVLDRLKVLRDGTRSHITDIRADMASLSSSIAGAFSGDLFSATTGAAFLNGASQTSNLIEKLKKAFKQLQKWGLSSQFLSQLFASGNSALILDLASGPRSTAQDSADLFGFSQSLGNQLGNQVARNQYGAQIDRLGNKLDRIEKAIKHVGPDVSRAMDHAAGSSARRR